MKTLPKKIKLDFLQLQVLTDELRKIQISMDEFRNNIIMIDIPPFQTLNEELNKVHESIDDFLKNVPINGLEETASAKNITPADYLSIIESGESGLNDISENHDLYLGEIIADEHIH